MTDGPAALTRFLARRLYVDNFHLGWRNIVSNDLWGGQIPRKAYALALE